MKNKTCGECKWFTEEPGWCTYYNYCVDKSDNFSEYDCRAFESKQRPTNGDKVRQLRNTDLAEILVYPVKPMNVNGNIYYEFTSCLLLGKSCPMREQAVFLTERRLNAPAESEGNNGEK